ncbi:MAG: haloacid dehalogenase-like hydrolase [Myxococcales bacterium]|nr:haloacid dehalogenase-like hydrolase [Myxococcales bacterium]
MPEPILLHVLVISLSLASLSLRPARAPASLLQPRAAAIRYAAPVELWSSDRVSARIEEIAQAQPGGVVATDGDGTLWSGDVGEDLFHAFVRSGRVETPALQAMRREARDHDLSDAGGGAGIARRIYEAYLAGQFPEERICELMTWCFAGRPEGEVLAFTRDVVAESQLESRIQPEVMRVLDRMRRAGIPTVVVSASPFHVVVEAAKRAGFAETEVVAARARFDATGIMLPEVDRPIPYGDGKVARLREHLGPGRVLYAAFGDNAFDVALLSSAGLGVAVRPKPRLRARVNEVQGIVELAP